MRPGIEPGTTVNQIEFAKQTQAIWSTGSGNRNGYPLPVGESDGDEQAGIVELNRTRQYHFAQLCEGDVHVRVWQFPLDLPKCRVCPPKRPPLSIIQCPTESTLARVAVGLGFRDREGNKRVVLA